VQNVLEVLSAVRATFYKDIFAQALVPPAGKSRIFMLLTTTMQRSFLRGIKFEGAGAAKVSAFLLRFVRVKHVALQRGAGVPYKVAIGTAEALLVNVGTSAGVVMPGTQAMSS
jgi:hypothetical protein